MSETYSSKEVNMIKALGGASVSRANAILTTMSGGKPFEPIKIDFSDLTSDTVEPQLDELKAALQGSSNATTKDLRTAVEFYNFAVDVADRREIRYAVHPDEAANEQQCKAGTVHLSEENRRLSVSMVEKTLLLDTMLERNRQYQTELEAEKSSRKGLEEGTGASSSRTEAVRAETKSADEESSRAPDEKHQPDRKSRTRVHWAGDVKPTASEIAQSAPDENTA
ncbi:hypothetical protein P7C73_g2089, partial [Tremellales sp. Uapishka_1]